MKMAIAYNDLGEIVASFRGADKSVDGSIADYTASGLKVIVHSDLTVSARTHKVVNGALVAFTAQELVDRQEAHRVEKQGLRDADALRIRSELLQKHAVVMESNKELINFLVDAEVLQEVFRST